MVHCCAESDDRGICDEGCVESKADTVHRDCWSMHVSHASYCAESGEVVWFFIFSFASCREFQSFFFIVYVL